MCIPIVKRRRPILFIDDLARNELVDFHRAPLCLDLEERVLVDDLPIDGIANELPRELDPFVDRRRSQLRMPRPS